MRLFAFAVIISSLLTAGCIVDGPDSRGQDPQAPKKLQTDKQGNVITQSEYIPKPIDWEKYFETSHATTKTITIFKGPRAGYLVTYIYPYKNEFGGIETKKAYIVCDHGFNQVGFFTPNGDTMKYTYTKTGLLTSEPRGKHTHDRAIKTLLNIEYDKELVLKTIDYKYILSERYPEPPEEEPSSPEDSEEE